MNIQDSNFNTNADIWRRLAALIYDLFLLVAISMAYGASVLILYILINGKPDEEYNQVWNGPLFQLGWYLSLLGFYLYFWRKDGQTLGMRAWRLKLVNAEGGIASLSSCLLRALVSPFTVGFFFLAYIWKFFDKAGLCLHDRISGTQVVILPKAKK